VECKRRFSLEALVWAIIKYGKVLNRFGPRHFEDEKFGAGRSSELRLDGIRYNSSII